MEIVRLCFVIKKSQQASFNKKEEIPGTLQIDALKKEMNIHK